MSNVTTCLIQWVDDKSEFYGNICECEFEECSEEVKDDEIFFYGLSRNRLTDACSTGEAICGEWRVLEVL